MARQFGAAGYVATSMRGEELPDDYICPICKRSASDFEKVINIETNKDEENYGNKEKHIT